MQFTPSPIDHVKCPHCGGMFIRMDLRIHLEAQKVR